MEAFSKFFGFNEDPFKRTPDVEFYYPTKIHQDALDTLQYSLESDEPFAVLVGEPGTGKTITIRKFISELPENIVVAYILFPNLSPSELFIAILEDFKVKASLDMNKNLLFSKFRDFLVDIKAQGKKAVIIIDEAQNLPSETLEELRILSNLETQKEKLIKIILAGQPELTQKLDSDNLRQLKQRITLYSYLSNIPESEIKNYINSHLIKAGRSSIRIQSSVVRRIAKITKGNPRLINTLMERTMIAAFLDNTYTITEEHLDSAIASVNTIISTIKRKKDMKNIKIASIAIIATICTIGAFMAVSFFGGKFYYQSQAVQNIAQAEQTQIPTESYNKQEPKTENNIITEEVETYNEPELTENITPNTISQEEEQVAVASNADLTTTSTTNNNFPFITAKEESSPVETEIATNTETNTTNDYAYNDYNSYEKEVDDTNVILPGTRIEILANSLNVRESPEMNALKISSVLKGQQFYVLADNPDWIKIRINANLNGWVYKRHTRVVE